MKAVMEVMMDEHQQALVKFHRQTLLKPPDILNKTYPVLKENMIDNNHNEKLIVPSLNCTSFQKKNFEGRVDEFIENFKAPFLSPKVEILLRSVT